MEFKVGDLVKVKDASIRYSITTNNLVLEVVTKRDRALEEDDIEVKFHSVLTELTSAQKEDSEFINGNKTYFICTTQCELFKPSEKQRTRRTKLVKYIDQLNEAIEIRKKLQEEYPDKFELFDKKLNVSVNASFSNDLIYKVKE
jgi:hypothetical protein